VVAGEVMTASPATISPTATIHEALRKMENRSSQISVLPVVDEAGLCVGLLRLHDLYQHQPSTVVPEYRFK